MEKLNKAFFDCKEILFIGYSGKYESFCNTVFQTLTNRGIKVYPLNSRSEANFNIKVYRSFNELPKTPSFAYVLTNQANSRKLLPQLKELGIKKALFQSKKNVDQATLDLCRENGIEAAIGCPMMLFGSGIHKIHAFFTGVK
jgi:acyl-CoA synthetase (NDP forming)